MLKNDQSTLVNDHYLWAVGLPIDKFPPKTLLKNRYLVMESQIVLDTQADNLPEILYDVSVYVSAYLKLSRFPLCIPRPYASVQLEEGDTKQELLLLDHAPISTEGKLYPNIRDSWASASAIGQVNLLWQILQLWKHLTEKRMASTLLETEFLRVSGPWVRILQLVFDEDEVKLSDLGRLWIDWLNDAKPEIDTPLANFMFGLQRGEFDLLQAIAFLEQLAQKQSESFSTKIRIASGTDKGPLRERNEDNCYPLPHQQERSQQSEKLRDRLAIVCDGVGGHQGGEIASSMAIESIVQNLEVLLSEVENSSKPFNPEKFIQQLDTVVRVANTQIVTLNDRQKNHDRQRMGTTLVMAVAPQIQGQSSREIYVVSVGDSRAYWIHPQSCDQVTIDDNVATRDVILGYNFYVYANQRRDSGSLIQALGVQSSVLLHPRIQRFPLDEDCLLLLCSDGLSDYSRIEEILEAHIRPILVNNLPLDQSVVNLINQANELNGHDNVTVALMRCQRSSLAQPSQYIY